MVLQHFNKGCQPGFNLAAVGSGVIGLQLHVGDTLFLTHLLHQGGLHIEGMAGLQHHFHNA